MSEHKGLADALLAFQGEVAPLKKDGKNPHFGNSYVTLDSITQMITPLLTEHELLWTTTPTHLDGASALGYRLTHAPSGESIDGVMPLLLPKQDPQGQGSALTYARRYAISAVLGLSAEDDDGNAASRPRQQAATTNGSTVTTEDADAIKAALKGMKPEQIQLAFAAVGIDPTKPIRTIPQAKAAPLVKALAEAAA